MTTLSESQVIARAIGCSITKVRDSSDYRITMMLDRVLSEQPELTRSQAILRAEEIAYYDDLQGCLDTAQAQWGSTPEAPANVPINRRDQAALEGLAAALISHACAMQSTLRNSRGLSPDEVRNAMWRHMDLTKADLAVMAEIIAPTPAGWSHAE